MSTDNNHTFLAIITDIGKKNQRNKKTGEVGGAIHDLNRSTLIF
jgi:hypothetical protein